MEISKYGSSDNQLKYNGKELQTEADLEWYDYGARFYDPVLGRWHSVDPMAEKYNSISPYHFSGNNPIKFVDNNGMNYDGYTIDEKGHINRVNDTGGNNFDVLYTKNDYDKAKQETKETGEKNEYGNPEPNNSVEVSSGTFSESNIISLGDVKGVKTSNESDAKAIFNFAAENFSVEYGMVSGDNNGNMSIVHTSGKVDYTETGKVAKYMIDQGFFLYETNHSHSGGIDYGSPSGFYTNGMPTNPLTGDALSAKWIDDKNGSAVNHFMYHPFTGKTYQYNENIYFERK
jgi:RHS repeat-associated protein